VNNVTAEPGYWCQHTVELYQNCLSKLSFWK